MSRATPSPSFPLVGTSPYTHVHCPTSCCCPRQSTTYSDVQMLNLTSSQPGLCSCSCTSSMADSCVLPTSLAEILTSWGRLNLPNSTLPLQLTILTTNVDYAPLAAPAGSVLPGEPLATKATLP